MNPDYHHYQQPLQHPRHEPVQFQEQLDRSISFTNNILMALSMFTMTLYRQAYNLKLLQTSIDGTNSIH